MVVVVAAAAAVVIVVVLNSFRNILVVSDVILSRLLLICSFLHSVVCLVFFISRYR